MRRRDKRYKIVGGVPIRPLPPVSVILKQFELDFDNWCLWTKPWPGHSRLEREWNKTFIRERAGKLTQQGYLRIRFNRQSCAEHRLIWKIVTGKDPVGFIDHINGIRDDNRIENLRDVTPAGNASNAIRGRWAADRANRKRLQQEQEAKEREERRVRIEQRERATLAKLKEKYESEPLPYHC